MPLNQEIADFKRDMEVVEAMGLYDMSSKKCEFSDEKTGTWAFCGDFCNAALAADNSFFYLETQGSTFFGHYLRDSLLMLKLSKKAEINKVILELKVSKFHQQIAEQAN